MGLVRFHCLTVEDIGVQMTAERWLFASLSCVNTRLFIIAAGPWINLSQFLGLSFLPLKGTLK